MEWFFTHINIRNNFNFSFWKTNKNYIISHRSLNYPGTEIRKNIISASAVKRVALGRSIDVFHSPVPAKGAGNGKYFPEEMHTRAWRITLDRCQSYVDLRVSVLWGRERGGSCRPATTRISESLVFSACPANTPFPVNYNYRRRLNVLRPERRLIFQMSSGCEGCARNSGKWGVFSIPFWSRELRFPSISLFSNNTCSIWKKCSSPWYLSLLMAKIDLANN